jgi:hypothetical protein
VHRRGALWPLILAAACASGDEPGGSAGTVHLIAWVTGPEPSAFTRKTNLIEGARRVNQELAAAGSAQRVSIDVDFNTTSHDPYV